jgi:hypothetical protein
LFDVAGDGVLGIEPLLCEFGETANGGERVIDFKTDCAREAYPSFHCVNLLGLKVHSNTFRDKEEESNNLVRRLSSTMARVAKLGLLLALMVGAGYVSNHTSREILQIAARVVMVRAFFVSLPLVGNILFGDDSILSIISGDSIPSMK